MLRPVISLLIAGVLVAACGGDDAKVETPSAADGIKEITRQLLAMNAPATAPGQTIELTRVIIPAGQQIAPHTHPGPQMAVIAEGTLDYTVVQGKVQVTRAAGTANARTETFNAGQTAQLQPGDVVTELPGMVHTARSSAAGPVVVYLSSLFPLGAPPSSPAQ